MIAYYSPSVKHCAASTVSLWNDCCVPVYIAYIAVAKSPDYAGYAATESCSSNDKLQHHFTPSLIKLMASVQQVCLAGLLCDLPGVSALNFLIENETPDVLVSANGLYPGALHCWHRKEKVPCSIRTIWPTAHLLAQLIADMVANQYSAYSARLCSCCNHCNHCKGDISKQCS